MKPRSALLALTALLAFAPSALADPLPVSSASPANGATVALGQNVTFSVTTTPHLGLVTVEIATQDVPGQDGTLAQDFTVGNVTLLESDAYPGTYKGTDYVSGILWAATPGTYYWEASATSYSSPCCPKLIGPVQTINVASAPAPVPTPPPTPAPSPVQPAVDTVNTAMTSSDAPVIVIKLIRSGTHRAPRNLKRRCHRLDSSSFSCNISWFDQRAVYAGTGIVEFLDQDGELVWNGSFDGLKATRSCLKHRSATACARHVSW